MIGRTALGIALTLAAAATAAEDPKKDAAANAAAQKAHAFFAPSCFNACWTLIDKPDRSPKETEDMLLLAYASLWHWKQRADCKPTNLSVGYWQVSRVHALAGQYEMARLFGEKCLRIGHEYALTRFHIGYAHEALARAEILRKDFAAAQGHLADARHLLGRVTDKEEKELLGTDLAELEKKLRTEPSGDSKQP